MRLGVSVVSPGDEIIMTEVLSLNHRIANEKDYPCLFKIGGTMWITKIHCKVIPSQVT
jgi:hypothetical protein